MEADRTLLTTLHTFDGEDLATLCELRDASTTLIDDLQAARAEVRSLNVNLTNEKRARAAAETREANVPAPSTYSREDLDHLKNELAES